MIRSSTPLILDCDGVLLNWIGGFTAYASHRLGKDLASTEQDDFDLSAWLGLTGDETDAMIGDFNQGDGGHFGRLDPLPGAREALAAAHSRGRPIFVVTSCSTLPQVIASRKANLRAVFGDIFSDIHCLDLHLDKSPVLRELGPGTWVEDKFENAIAGADIGLTSYLIRYDYNRKHEPTGIHPNLTWVDGWGCIRSHESLH